MSNSVNIIQRPGAYEHPFSGRGIEFSPLGTQAGQTGITLHETGYDPSNSDWNFPSVLSPFWRVYYNFEKTHCILFGEEFHQLGPEHIVLIPDHHLFHCLGQHPTPSFWMHFSFDRKSALDQKVPILLTPDETELSLIRLISKLVPSRKIEALDRIQHLSAALLNILVSRPEIQWQPPLPEKLIQLMQFIEHNVERKLPNPILAKESGISVEGIYRLFRAHLGTSPANYANQIRIRKASHLLTQNDFGIDEIAELTGFPNRAYFSRVFKKITGISPGTYRRSQQRNPPAR